MTELHWCCILPGGNEGEFPDLDAEMCERGVKAQYSQAANGTRMYRIPVSDLDKLPRDAQGPYFGDDDSGHALNSQLDAAAMEDYRRRLGGAAWTDVTREPAP